MANLEKKISLTNGLEYFLLCLVAVIGLAGSIYMFASNAQKNANNNFNQFATAPIVDSEEDVSSFSDYIKVSGKRRVDGEISFETKMDIKEKRYVMEMGDGMRMIITAPSFTYKYSKKGKYTLELKTIERGLITTIATKTLKIK